jgi:hypothetical protein
MKYPLSLGIQEYFGKGHDAPAIYWELAPLCASFLISPLDRYHQPFALPIDDIAGISADLDPFIIRTFICTHERILERPKPAVNHNSYL